MIFSKVLNFLVPPRCIKCGNLTAEDHQLCADCWKEITFIVEPFCKKCGHPLEISPLYDASSEGDGCHNCLGYAHFYDQVRSVFVYNEIAKKLLVRFKHGDATYLTPTFSRWLKQKGEEFISSSDYLIPVPLHWKRLLYRRYNQSALLCISLLKLLPHKPIYAPYILRRKRHTLSQGHKTISQRQENIEGAFIVPERYKNQLKGKTVVLVDDVMTTGATIQECSRTLKEAGCKKVYVLTIARAVKGY
jgi:ComF family protein